MSAARTEPGEGVPAGFLPLHIGGKFLHANGPLFVRHEDGRVWLGMRIEARHCNPRHVCHGGMIATFCDMLVPVTVHRVMPEAKDRFLPTISLQLDYLAPAPLGAWLQGEAQILRSTRSMLFTQGLVHADGAPCTRMSGVFKLGPLLNQEI